MHDDDWEDDLDEDDEDNGYIDCPHCGQSMLEAADYCPSCDRWMSDEDTPKKSQPLWLIIGIVICLVISLGWILRP